MGTVRCASKIAKKISNLFIDKPSFIIVVNRSNNILGSYEQFPLCKLIFCETQQYGTEFAIVHSQSIELLSKMNGQLEESQNANPETYQSYNRRSSFPYSVYKWIDELNNPKLLQELIERWTYSDIYHQRWEYCELVDPDDKEGHHPICSRLSLYTKWRNRWITEFKLDDGVCFETIYIYIYI